MRNRVSTLAVAFFTAFVLIGGITAMFVSTNHRSTTTAESDESIGLSVADGYVIERVAGKPQVSFPTFATFDDRGRLFVVESSGRDYKELIDKQLTESRIKLLEDRDNDGYFEHVEIFEDNLVFPMGLAWRDGQLYVADQPRLLVLPDKNHDGRADSRSVLIDGFGPSDNGGLHGLTFGPDGMLYMTVGQLNGKGKQAYRLHADDGTVISGRSGALLRCAPDGTHQEVVCRGFVQLVEIDFLPDGEIVGPVQYWYGLSHEEGECEALALFLEGGLYPNQPDDGTPQLISGVALPPISIYPKLMASGVTRYRGSGLSDPTDRDLYIARYNTGTVMRHRLTRSGSSFRVEDESVVTPSTSESSFNPSDILESADGSLIVIDTGDWYKYCGASSLDVANRGGIYRVRRINQETLSDPWGRQIDWQAVVLDRLIEYLSDERPMVRDRAQRALVERGTSTVTALGGLLEGPNNPVAKRHAIWALANIGEPQALAEIRRVFAGNDDDLIALAARAVASRHDRVAASQLCRLLEHESPHVRLAAAESLARCGTTACLPELFSALSAGPDSFLEHALIHAVFRVADKEDLVNRLVDGRPQVRRAALRLLSQSPHDGATQEMLITLNSSADDTMRNLLAEVVLAHPEWDEAATAILDSLLARAEPDEKDEQRIIELLVTFESHPSVQILISKIASDSRTNRPLRSRTTALRAMAHSEQSPTPLPWIEAVVRAIGDSNHQVRLEQSKWLAL